ncbi:unnamed protein product [Closterium sp. NIES-54]
MSRQVARALLGRAEPLLQRHVACSGGGSSHAVTSYIGNGHRHACGRVKSPVLPVNVNPMLSPSYGARRFSSSASAESAPKHKPDVAGSSPFFSYVFLPFLGNAMPFLPRSALIAPPFIAVPSTVM